MKAEGKLLTVNVDETKETLLIIVNNSGLNLTLSIEEFSELLNLLLELECL